MQKRNSLIGLITAVLIGTMIAVGIQAFSGLTNTSGQESVAIQDVTVKPINIIPVDSSLQTAKPMDIKIGGTPLAVPPKPDLSQIPTSEPVSAAPALAALAANEHVLLSSSSGINNDLSKWTFSQVYREPTKAPEWSVNNEESTENMLVSPRNWKAMTILNDVMAIPPTTLSGDGTIDVNALTRAAAKVGLIADYVDDQNYVAMIFGTVEARRMASPGLSLIRVQEGKPEILAYDDTTVMKTDQWYNLHLEVVGNVLKASVDGGKPLTATLSQSFTGQKFGLYAGSEGSAFFNNLRVTGTLGE